MHARGEQSFHINEGDGVMPESYLEVVPTEGMRFRMFLDCLA